MTLYLCKEESYKWSHKHYKLYPESKELEEKYFCSVVQGSFKETFLISLLGTKNKQKSLQKEMKASILW